MTNNKPAKVVILSGPIQTGKSAALLRWVEGKEVAGVITPTIDNRKYLCDIGTGITYPYQLGEETLDCIRVGKYFLDREAFDVTMGIVDRNVLNPKDWFVLDEIGKLELLDQGHHLSLVKLLGYWERNLFLVVRDNLLEKVVENYGLRDAGVIYKDVLEDFG